MPRAVGSGVVWAYEPKRALLTAIYVSLDAEALDNPDNVTLCRSGLLIACEDNGRAVGARLIGIEPDGDSFGFACNNVVIESALAGGSCSPRMQPRRQERVGVDFQGSIVLNAALVKKLLKAP